MKHLPAEWEPQQGVLLTWPHQLSDWKKSLPEIEKVYRQLVHHISQHESVFIIYYGPSHRRHIETQLELAHEQQNRIHFFNIKTNDTWIRDYGPISTIENSRHKFLDFRFNGWGNKYDASFDNKVNDALQEQTCFINTSMDKIEQILEGGSIDSNGEGLLLTTTQCLLSNTRNPDMTQAEIESMLCETLGVQKVLWLNEGKLEGDDTDSHIDNLARFCNGNTILYSRCDDKSDSHFTTLANMETELQNLTSNSELNLKLIALPLPNPQYNKDGRRLAASYNNFLIINNAVLVPCFDTSSDETAMEIIRAVFPDRKVIAIDSRALIQQNGGIHCATMQIPYGNQNV